MLRVPNAVPEESAAHLPNIDDHRLLALLSPGGNADHSLEEYDVSTTCGHGGMLENCYQRNEFVSISPAAGFEDRIEDSERQGSSESSNWMVNSSTITTSNGRCTIVVNGNATPPPESDALDFGERLSCGSVEPGREDINECYNVKLNAPQEVIVAGFHDFCQTMLSIEEPPLDHDSSSMTPQGGRSMAVMNNQKAFRGFPQSAKPYQSRVPSDRLAPNSAGAPRRASNPVRIDSVTSRAVVYSSKVVVGKVCNTEQIVKKDVDDAEVMAAIRELDKSLADAIPPTEEPVPDCPPPPAVYSGRTRSNSAQVQQKPETATDREVQNDNLIEEVLLQGRDQRISDDNCDSVTLSNALTATRITVTGQVPKIGLSSPANSSTVVEVTDRTEPQTTQSFTKPIGGLSMQNCGGQLPLHENSLGSPRTEYESTKSSLDSASTSPSVPSPNLGADHRQSSSPPDVAACHRTSPCSVDSGNSSHHQNFFVVVAIDFGTTYSGYAFSFTRDPDNIHMMKKWDGGDPGVINQKTPTTLLLTPEGNFHSFGYSARDYYHDLDPQETKSWLYFEKFKMALHHNEHLSLETEIKASNGKSVPAVRIFALALQYFKEQALQEITDQSVTRILNEDVRWVVTVPAIWKQPAKQFMRNAAYEAGMASADFPDQLLIALEPEAASIYCRRMRMNQLIPDNVHERACLHSPKGQTEIASNNTVNNKDYLSSTFLSREVLESSFTPGTRYMVVDCGGGTVDITAHELLDNQGTLKELQKATGGPYGSVGVDMEFERLLGDIFGEEFMQQFKTKRPTGYVDLMVAFEARKRNVNPYKNTPLNISLPFCFIDYYKKCKGSTVEAALKKYSNKEVKWSSQGMLRLEPGAMQRLFKKTVDQIKHHITEILSNPKLGIDLLFLVGGFSESLILQKEIRDAFSSRTKVVIPQGVSLAILKGAVLFGLDPTIVNIRRLRMTYGAGVLNRFIHGVHPPEKLVVKDGIQWCADVFDKFVITDQSVGRGDVVIRSYTPAKATQRCTVIHIYCSERDDVHFITDPGVQRCATLILDISEKYIHCREIQTRMMFGDTEIKVTALDVATGKCVKADVDFLGH